ACPTPCRAHASSACRPAHSPFRPPYRAPASCYVGNLLHRTERAEPEQSKRLSNFPGGMAGRRFHYRPDERQDRMPDERSGNEMRYPRDMRGYGANPPNPEWPGGAHVAVQFVVNYEEGGENCVLHGDAASEAFLSEVVGAAPWPGKRHWNMESIYEYGARA